MRLPTHLRTASAMLTGLAFIALSAPLCAQTSYAFSATYTGGLSVVGFNPGPPPVAELAGTGSGPATFGLNTVSLDLFAQNGATTATGVGNFVHTAINGDKLFGYTPDEVVQLGAAGNPHFTFTGDEFITGGTGLFAGATGNIPFSGFGDYTSSTTNTFTYTNTGFVVIVPEPGLLALIGALSIPSIAMSRCRRHFTDGSRLC